MIEFGHLTHVGLRRELNEDTYYGDSDLGLWLVADGMGGHEYGEVASALARETIVRQVRSGSTLIPEEVRVYLRDVLDHSVRMNDSIDNMRDMLGTALSVNLSLVTLAQGETVKRLGAWAALLAAPTLVTSWYGMNFEHMPELAPPWAYPVLIVGVAVICVGLYSLFKRARWL